MLPDLLALAVFGIVISVIGYFRFPEQNRKKYLTHLILDYVGLALMVLAVVISLPAITEGISEAFLYIGLGMVAFQNVMRPYYVVKAE